MKKVKITQALLFLIAVMFMWVSPVLAQSTDVDFEQAVIEYQQSPMTAAAEKVIKLAAAMGRLPAIPEEGRRHFVRGTALFRDANSPDDFNQVLDEFKQATDLAPWWPEARYNWALAYEAAGDYAEAIDHLNLYLLFKLPEAEARAVQDKIYVLEAKQEKAAKEKEYAEERKLEEKKLEEKKLEEKKLEEENDENCDNRFLLITKNSRGEYVARYFDNFCIFTEVKVRGRSLMTKESCGNGSNIQVSNYTLSDDGKRLEGTYTIYYPDGRVAQQTSRSTFYRK
jgi:tetratricopeptide (TPR) repeat protein